MTRRGATTLIAVGAVAYAPARAPGAQPAATRERADVPIATRRISPQQFERWLVLRGGLERPAYWYSEGLVRPIGEDGRAVSRMLGVETWITPRELRTSTSAVSLSRKIFFYLELDRDEVLRDRVSGAPTRPSIFIHQLRTFTLDARGELRYAVESHNLSSISQGGQNSIYVFTQIGEQLHVNYSTYPLRPQPDGRTRSTSGEIYDYVDNGPQVSASPQRFQMSWVGANLEGRIQNMRGWRFDSFDEVPNAWLKAMIRERAPEWTAPPSSMSQIEALRRRVPYEVPGLGL